MLELSFFWALTACGTKKEISLPEAKEITEQDEIAKIVNDIKEKTKDTGGKSYHDQPATLKIFWLLPFIITIRKGTRMSFIYMKIEKRPMLNNPIQGFGKSKKKYLKRLAIN